MTRDIERITRHSRATAMRRWLLDFSDDLRDRQGLKLIASILRIRVESTFVAFLDAPTADRLAKLAGIEAALPGITAALPRKWDLTG